MKTYQDMLADILTFGIHKENRTGIPTRRLFGYQFRHDLNKGFPLVTTKKMFWKGIVCELLWFIKGTDDISYLQENGVNIWNEWAVNNKVGPVYGVQWRNWGGDQLSTLIQNLQKNPDSRRHILSAWNVEELDEMKLPPCHVMSQFDVTNGRLSCHLYQRSADVFLGVPFNIASYALLTHIIAQLLDLQVGELIISYGDLHMYTNHVAQCVEQVTKIPYDLPKLQIEKQVSIDDYQYEDFKLINYKSHPTIKGDIAV